MTYDDGETVPVRTSVADALRRNGWKTTHDYTGGEPELWSRAGQHLLLDDDGTLWRMMPDWGQASGDGMAPVLESRDTADLAKRAKAVQMMVAYLLGLSDAGRVNDDMAVRIAYAGDSIQRIVDVLESDALAWAMFDPASPPREYYALVARADR